MPTALRDRPPGPTAVVIFGAAGDLTSRKLVPALHDLSVDGHLPERFTVVAVDRAPMDDEALRRSLLAGVRDHGRRKPDAASLSRFAPALRRVRGDLADPDTFARLARALDGIDREWGVRASRLYYLATPPAAFAPVARQLCTSGLCPDPERSRVVVEKPFGRDLASARELNRVLAGSFDESQVLRIDHYLGKETVQNLLAFRFANPMWEPLWDRRYVDHFAITVAEDLGVQHRGGYYDRSGALRDMVQNHLMQLLCLVAMEPPIAFTADEVRNRKVDVLHAVRPIPPDRVDEFAVRGQYGPGWVRGERVPGYRQEARVDPRSATETFAALKLFVDNWRWHGVPFYLRTGKRLPSRASEVSIRFRDVPHQAFPPESLRPGEAERLVVCIQPEEGILLKFQAKQPGQRMVLQPVDMRFRYRDAFPEPSPDAYETLLLDAMQGDAALFMRADQVEAAWTLLMPVLEAWESMGADLPSYPAGSWGPASAERLVSGDGRTWLPPVEL